MLRRCGEVQDGEGWNGQYDGPYSTGLYYDVWGNLTVKEGWGGVNPSYTATYTNNRRDGFDYDAAGNLTHDGQQIYTYDATGQQATASGTTLTQSYDGDGVRARKVESGATTYYLRSSVLGKQVVAEINANGTFKRGYVYLGGQLLALQENNQVSWVHQDPITKSQRLTNSAGIVISWAELDPWGAEAASSNSQMQPHRYTSYERDANGGDEAMFRRYEGKWQRFAQPDPYDGSYNLTDPQSFNRYAYVQSDPVNFVDPTGLLPNIWGTLDGYGAGHGFWGWGGGYSGGNGWGRDPRPGLREIRRDEEDLHPLGRVIGVSEFYFIVSHHFNSLFWDSSFFYGYRPQETPKEKDQRHRKWIKCWNDAIEDDRRATKEINNRYDAQLKAAFTSNIKQSLFWAAISAGTVAKATKNPKAAAIAGATVFFLDAGKGIAYELLFNQVFNRKGEEGAASDRYNARWKQCDKDFGPRDW